MQISPLLAKPVDHSKEKLSPRNGAASSNTSGPTPLAEGAGTKTKSLLSDMRSIDAMVEAQSKRPSSDKKKVAKFALKR